MKGWVGLVGWPTAAGWLTHISGHPAAAGRAQDSESFPASSATFYHCATPPTTLVLGYTKPKIVNIRTSWWTLLSAMTLQRRWRRYAVDGSPRFAPMATILTYHTITRFLFVPHQVLYQQNRLQFLFVVKSHCVKTANVIILSANSK